MKPVPDVTRRNSGASWPATLPGVVIGAFFFLLPFIASFDGFEKFRIPKNIFASLAVILAAASLLVAHKLEARQRPSALESAIGVLVLYVGAHSLLVGKAGVSLPVFYQLLYFAVLLCLLSVITSEQRQRSLWTWIGAAGAVNAIFTVVQYYGYFTILQRPTGGIVEGRLNPAGFIGDAGSGGFLFALACLMQLQGLAAPEIPRLRAISAALFVVNLVGLAFTGTLTAIGGFALCLGLWLLYYRWWLLQKRGGDAKRTPAPYWVWLGLGVVLAGAALLSETGDRVASRWWQVQQGDWTAATSGRLPVYRITWRMIRDQPWFGRGLGTFGQDFFYYRTETVYGRQADLIDQPGIFRETHNDYLQVWDELGIPGLVLCLSILAGSVLLGWRESLSTADPKHAHWAAILSIGMILVAIDAAGSFPLQRSVTGAYIVLLLAGLLQASMGSALALRSSVRNSAWQKSAVVLLALAFSYPQVQKWLANSEMGAAARLIRNAATAGVQPQQRRATAAQALALLENAKARHGGFEEIGNLQGTALTIAGRPEEAIVRFREAASLIPSPEVYTNMGVASLALNDYDQAQRLIEAALRYNPNFPQALQAMEYLKSRQSQR